MKMKRHMKILEIIAGDEIETQEELAEKLRESGFEVTQATISRDIREMRLVKVQTESGSYKYASGLSEKSGDSAVKFRAILTQTILKIDYAGNLVVIKCHSGMAAAAAAAVDSMNRPEVVGTIAGDDTILMVMHTQENAAAFSAELLKMIRA